MTLRWALVPVVLVLSAAVPAVSDAQSASQPKSSPEAAARPVQSADELKRMTFSVGDAPNCSERGRLYKVSLKVYNVLAQLVAVPVLRDGESAPRDDERPLENVLLSCDEYTAYWDGRNASTAKVAAPGMYLYKLEVDGRPIQVKKVIVK